MSGKRTFYHTIHSSEKHASDVQGRDTLGAIHEAEMHELG